MSENTAPQEVAENPTKKRLRPVRKEPDPPFDETNKLHPKLYSDSDGLVLIPIQKGLKFHETVAARHLTLWIGVNSFNAEKKTSVKVLKNVNEDFYGWKCINDNCTFKFVVRNGKKTDWCWTVDDKNTCLEHASCVGDADPRRAVIRNSLQSNIILSDSTTGKEILESCKKSNIEIGGKKKPGNDPTHNSTPRGYYKAIRMKQDVLSSRVDPFVDGFTYLPHYLDVIREQNTGLLASMEVTLSEDGTSEQFLRLFLMTKGQATCASLCKPIISYDGAFMKVIVNS